MSTERKDWTPNQLAFIEWLATPKALRKTADQRAFAANLGINEATLSRWKNLPGLTDAANARARRLVMAELPEVYGALAREAKAGSFQHMKLLFEMAGEHRDAVDLNVSDARERLRAKLGSRDELASRRTARDAS